MRLEPLSGTGTRAERTPAGSISIAPSSRHSRRAPAPASSSRVISTSPMRGAFSSVVRPSARRAATMALVAKFLAPRLAMRPPTGRPPRIT